jgi:serine/threonine protein kinase
MLDVFESDQMVYLIFEFCDGGDYAQFLNRQGRLDEEEARYYMKQLVEGLQYLSAQNIIHRDLKPQNLLLQTPTTSSPPSPTTNYVLKIADFGFARRVEPQDMAATICGSPLYMAPELLSMMPYTSKADAWSLGVILYKTVTGQQPVQARNPYELMSKMKSETIVLPSYLTSSCKNLLIQLLRKKEQDRSSIDDIRHHEWFTQSSTLPKAKTEPRRSKMSSTSSLIKSNKSTTNTNRSISDSKKSMTGSNKSTTGSTKSSTDSNRSTTDSTKSSTDFSKSILDSTRSRADYFSGPSSYGGSSHLYSSKNSELSFLRGFSVSSSVSSSVFNESISLKKLYQFHCALEELYVYARDQPAFISCFLYFSILKHLEILNEAIYRGLISAELQPDQSLAVLSEKIRIRHRKSMMRCKHLQSSISPDQPVPSFSKLVLGNVLCLETQASQTTPLKAKQCYTTAIFLLLLLQSHGEIHTRCLGDSETLDPSLIRQRIRDLHKKRRGLYRSLRIE